ARMRVKADKKRKRARIEQEMLKKVAPSWQPSAVQQTCFGGCIGGILVENQGSIHPSMPHRVSVANPRWRP
ncbi:hypothetical protein NQZ68_018679, partial [Dissostichus eleginoides]